MRSELASNSLNLVWHFWVPYEFQVIPKKLFFDRALTRPNLFKLKVISDPVNTSCQLCDGSVESVDHLFVTCGVAFKFGTEYTGCLGESGFCHVICYSCSKG